jgi:hypothetical protein
MFPLLPIDIFREIRSFTKEWFEFKRNKGFSNLLNTCKLFKTVKYEIIQLTCRSYNNSDCLAYLSVIAHLIKNVRQPHNQLCVEFGSLLSSDDAIPLFNFFSLAVCSTILSVGLSRLEFNDICFPETLSCCFRNVKIIAFHGCVNVKLDKLEAIESLELTSMNDLIDVSDIKKISGLMSISIIYCKNLIDISPLYGINKVKISHCEGIICFNGLGNHMFFSYQTDKTHAVSDISMFQSIDDVRIICGSFRCDLSSLQNVKEHLTLGSMEHRMQFKFKYFSGKKLNLTNFDLGSLPNSFYLNCSYLQHLELFECIVEDFKTLSDPQHPLRKTLLSMFLRNCLRLSDVSTLGFVPMLYIDGCPMVTSLKGFGARNKDIYIRGINASDFAPLHNIEKVFLSSHDFFSLGVSSLENIRHLLIYYGTFSEAIPVINIYRLVVHGCKKLKSLNGLAKIRNLFLSGCPELEDIDNLGNILELKVVRIEQCPRISVLHSQNRYIDSLKETIPHFSILD